MAFRSDFPCILLAAGGGSRMGGDKLLLPLAGEATLRRSARVALEACQSVVVVLGSGADKTAQALEGMERLQLAKNPDWSSGMVGSAQAGIRALLEGRSPLQPIEGFFLHLADMPFAQPEDYAFLQAAWDAWSGGAKPAFAAARSGRRGHPVLFPGSWIHPMLNHAPGERLADLLSRGGHIMVETGNEGVLEDLDEPEDYIRLLRKYHLPDTWPPVPVRSLSIRYE
ncbi:MAG TPA: nucleotidyltransferase family protein [Rectinemataceae bacterium]